MGDSCRYVPVLRIFRHARRAPLPSLGLLSLSLPPFALKVRVRVRG